MITSWQPPWSEIEIPIKRWRRNIIASAYWKDRDTIEIHVFDRDSDEFLLPEGYWISAKKFKEGILLPVAKTVPAKELLDRGIIKPLEPGRHVISYYYDRCHTCGMTGQEYLANPLPCPGWSP